MTSCEPEPGCGSAAWSARIERARSERLPGDLLVLAEEAPSDALQVLAWLAAGDVLLELGRPGFALEQFLKALTIDPSNRHAKRKELSCMQGAAVPSVAPSFCPRQVFLFSGHMADAAQRKSPRFPRQLHAAAAEQIAEILEQNQAGAEDLALTQGASGGDLIFLEACAARSMHLNLMLPLSESEFIRQSVLSAEDGVRWEARYLAIRRTLTEPPRILPDALGLPTAALSSTETNPFERCNRWLLNTALAYGIEKLHFICLWDGQGGDGPGGTAHMVEEVRRRSGRVYWIDTRSLKAGAPQVGN